MIKFEDLKIHQIVRINFVSIGEAISVITDISSESITVNDIHIVSSYSKYFIVENNYSISIDKFGASWSVVEILAISKTPEQTVQEMYPEYFL